MYTAPTAQGGGTDWMGLVGDLGGTLGPMLLARNDPNMAIAAQKALGLLASRRETAAKAAEAGAQKQAFNSFLERGVQQPWTNPGGPNPNAPPSQAGVLSGAGLGRGHVDYLKMLDPAAAQEILNERLFPEQDKIERNINAAAQHGVDPRAAWMVEHGLTPTADKALGERGLMARHTTQSGNNAATNAAANFRHLMQSGNNAATVAASRYGTDVGAETSRRGQDMTQQTALSGQNVTMRGQDLGRDTALSGQGVTMRGQDMAAGTAAAGRSQAAQQFNEQLRISQQNADSSRMRAQATADGKMAPQTTINNGGANETEFQKKLAGQYAEEYSDIRTIGRNSYEMAGQLDSVKRELDSGVYTGPLGKTNTTLNRFAAAIGVPNAERKAASGELVNSVANQMAMYIRNPDNGGGLPGAASERDVQFLLDAVPGLGKTEAGNRKIINTFMEIIDRRQAISAMADKWVAEKGAPGPEFNEAVRQALGSESGIIQQNLKDFSQAGGVSMPVGPLDVGAEAVIDGVTIRRNN